MLALEQVLNTGRNVVRFLDTPHSMWKICNALMAYLVLKPRPSLLDVSKLYTSKLFNYFLTIFAISQKSNVYNFNNAIKRIDFIN